MENLLCPHYFKFVELIKTNTGLTNYPTKFEHIQNLLLLGSVLDYIRNEVQKPIIVNSAFRTTTVNNVVGGVPTSYHLRGLAADITCSDYDLLGSVLDNMHVCGWFVEFLKYPGKNFYHIAIDMESAFVYLRDNLTEKLSDYGY